MNVINLGYLEKKTFWGNRVFVSLWWVGLDVKLVSFRFLKIKMWRMQTRGTHTADHVMLLRSVCSARFKEGIVSKRVLTWWRVRRGWNRFWPVISEAISGSIVMETCCFRHHGSGSRNPSPVVGWSEIRDGLVVHVVPGSGGVGRIVAPSGRGEALVAGGHRGVARPRCRCRRVFVFRCGGGSSGGWRPEEPFPRVTCGICEVVVGGVGVLLEVVVRRVIPLAVVSDDPLAVVGGSLCGDVQRRRGVGGDARRRPAGGGGRWGRRRTRHPAGGDGRRGALGRRRGTLLVDAAVHHWPPRHPGGRPRSGGWGGAGGVHMVVQGGRARHGVRDGEDDGAGSQHRRPPGKISEKKPTRLAQTLTAVPSQAATLQVRT